MSDADFSDRFRAAFAASGLTKAELSRRTGVSYDIINKLERGDNRTTSPEKAAALAAELNFPAVTGFAEPAPVKDVYGLLDRKAEPDTEIALAIVGATVQVRATVSKDQIANLIRRLELARQMLD